MPPVSVIILNYNSAKFVVPCLDSVLGQDYPTIDITVVDNASTDGSPGLISERYPQVKLIVNEVNEGFSGGMNRGIEGTSGAYLLLLNPDVVLSPGYVSGLVDVLERHPQAGAATGKTYRMGDQDPPVIDSTGHEIYANRLLTDRGEDMADSGLYTEEEEVFGVCAGMSMYRREMLDDIKLGGEYFDEDFFIFLEDVDLNWRARLRGWESFYTPVARARHHRGGVAKRRTVIVEKNNYKNRYFVLLKNDSPLGMLLSLHHFVITDTLKTGKLLLRCPAALLGWVDVWRCFPRMVVKRRAIQKHRKISPRAIGRRWFKPFSYKAWISRNLWG